MSEDEFFSNWQRRRWRFPTANLFDELEQDFESMFKDLELPKDLIRERKLPDGGTVREMGPFVYGYSFSMGPDGKPVIREFGNVKPSLRGGPSGGVKPRLDVKEDREPLVDTIVNPDTVKVVAELPGVEKPDIALECDGHKLTLKVDTDKRRYYKELELPVEVDPDTSKASYKNGVLELLLTRKKTGSKAKQIAID
ncbi:Hsp20/alpha crystallin family protein [Candidatus Bathyarchaeota archaeon]|nr:MAG: Hsp20/alpha crystallin family protein [Candidatus Bathyarchaeota archaeon]TMI59217.1 MAG: Hsp20/alpha crystallin family protein [Candidatus Bathyarchaeota archaeon]